MDFNTLKELLSFLGNAGALLAAVFSGWTLWRSISENKLFVTTTSDGSITVNNPARHSVLIRNIHCTKGTLWKCLRLERGRAIYGDSGLHWFDVSTPISPLETETLPYKLLIEGKIYSCAAKVRCVRLFKHEHVDLLLTPIALLPGEEE